MNKHYSLYLDVVRFLASLFVVLDHFRQHQILDDISGRFVPEIGREAVIIFFILSGYVIAYTTEIKQQELKDYVVARCARIYSVALPIMLLAFVLNFMSNAYSNPALAPSYQVAKAYFYIPFHLLFLGELWSLSEVPPWLIPYWSLSYEVWYYIFFATLYYLSSYKRLFFGVIVFLILGYKLWLLLPVWMSGVLLFRYQNKYPLGIKLARLGWVFSIVALVFYKYSNLDHYLHMLGVSIWPFKALPLGSASRYLADYSVAMIVLVNFFCARYSHFSVLENFSQIIRTISSYTFTLYLVHMLVISMWLSFYLHDPLSVVDIVRVSVLIGLSTYLIGIVTEQKKLWISSTFDRFFSQVFRAAGVFRNR